MPRQYVRSLQNHCEKEETTRNNISARLRRRIFYFFYYVQVCGQLMLHCPALSTAGRARYSATNQCDFHAKCIERNKINKWMEKVQKIERNIFSATTECGLFYLFICGNIHTRYSYVGIGSRNRPGKSYNANDANCVSAQVRERVCLRCRCHCRRRLHVTIDRLLRLGAITQRLVHNDQEFCCCCSHSVLSRPNSRIVKVYVFVRHSTTKMIKIYSTMAG